MVRHFSFRVQLPRGFGTPIDHPRNLTVHIHAQGRERMAEARQRLSARQSHGSASDDELDNVHGASDEESVRAVVCVRAGAIEGWADTKGRLLNPKP